MDLHQYNSLLERETLRVVLLGPGEAQESDLKKRHQLKSRLIDEGYALAKLGEDLIGNPEMPLQLALISELRDIDLLLVLNTGPAPLAELASISHSYKAKEIIKVWSKREYMNRQRSTPGDIVSMFENSMFSPEEFESCELIESLVAVTERVCITRAHKEGRLISLGLLPPHKDSIE